MDPFSYQNGFEGFQPLLFPRLQCLLPVQPLWNLAPSLPFPAQDAPPAMGPPSATHPVESVRVTHALRRCVPSASLVPATTALFVSRPTCLLLAPPLFVNSPRAFKAPWWKQRGRTNKDGVLAHSPRINHIYCIHVDGREPGWKPFYRSTRMLRLCKEECRCGRVR